MGTPAVGHLAINVEPESLLPISVAPINAAHCLLSKAAANLYVIRLFFQPGYAEADGVQILGELGSQLFNHCLLLVVGNLLMGAGAGDELCHLITGNSAVAAESAVTEAGNDAFLVQLGNCLYSPVVSRYIRVEHLGRLSSVC